MARPMTAQPRPTSAIQPVFPHVLDATIVSHFRLCQYKMMIEHVLGYRPKAPNIHLHFGGCLAKGLEIARRAFYLHQKQPHQCLADGVRAIFTEWGDWPVRIEEGKWTERNKSLEACVSSLALYLEKWPLGIEPARPIRTATGAPAIEIVHPIPIPDVPVHPVTGRRLYYAIRADMVVEMFPTGWKMGFDDKSSGTSIDSSWHDKFRLRNQFLGYTWGLRQLGVPVKGIVIRGVAPLSDRIELVETMVLPTDMQIDRWLRMLKITVVEMVNCWKTGLWKWDFADGCTAFNRPCEYMKLCLANDPMAFIDTDYHVDRWDPLEQRG